MTNINNLNSFIDRIYKAVISPDDISAIVQDMANVVDAPYSSFQIEDIVSHNLHKAFLNGYDDSAIEKYMDYYITIDPWAERNLDLALQAEDFQLSQDVLIDKEYCNTEFYQDWGRDFGVRHALGAAFEIDDIHAVKIGFQRHCDHKEFSIENRNFLRYIHPHLRQFTRMCSLFDDTDKDYSDITAMDLINRPVWLISKNMVLIYHNHQGEQWLSKGDFLIRKENQLQFRESRLNTLLTKSLARIFDNSNLLSSKSHRIYINHNGMEETFWIMKTPFSEQNLESAFLIGPKSIPLHSDFNSQFGITARQAEITLLLAQGRTLSQIASDLNISINTVRNQLATCFKQLNIRSQAELVKLVFSTPTL